jgi:hypothetical protein
LLGNLLALGVIVNQALDAAQLPFNARKACAQGFFLLRICKSRHGVQGGKPL